MFGSWVIVTAIVIVIVAGVLGLLLGLLLGGRSSGGPHDDRHGVGLPLRVPGADHHRRPAARQSDVYRGPAITFALVDFILPLALAVQIGRRAGTAQPAPDPAAAPASA